MAHLTEGVLLASGARTTTQTLTPGISLGAPMGAPVGLEVVLDLTAFTTAASLTMSIQAYDPGKEDWITLLADAAVTSISTSMLRIGRGVPTVANESIGVFVPLLWRVVVTHGNANSHTYSVSARVLSE